MSYYNNYENRKMPFSQEQMEQARRTSILEVAQNLGLELVRHGSNTMTAKGYGGLVFFHPEAGNGYHWHSQDQSGDVIKFVQDWEEVDFKRAVEIILGTHAYSHVDYYEPPPPKPKPVFVLPNQDDNARQVYAYLAKVRGIEPSVLNTLLAQKLLFQSKEERNGKTYRNCAFVGYDKDKIPKHCSLRSPSATYKFTQDVTGSDKSYSFSITGRSSCLYVFEAPIDAISHASMMAMGGADWTVDHRVAQGGLTDKALPRYLADYPEVTEIVFCYDNDMGNFTAKGTPLNQGQDAARKHAQAYEQMGFNTYIQTPQSKDFNGDLLLYREALAQQNQTTEGEWER